MSTWMIELPLISIETFLNGRNLFRSDGKFGEKDAENIVNLCYELLTNVNWVEPVSGCSYICADETLEEHSTCCYCTHRRGGGWADDSSVLTAQEHDRTAGSDVPAECLRSDERCPRQAGRDRHQESRSAFRE